MEVLSVIAGMVIISAIFSYVNERLLKLPSTIGVVILSLIVAIFILLFGKSNSFLTESIIHIAKDVDFSDLLLDVLLGFLLYAGALQFDYGQLKKLYRPVITLSTMSVIISGFVFAGLMYGVTLLLHIDLPVIYCLVFGALMSPTDPVAVGALLKKSTVPKDLQTIISGESMFNDGLGIVMFVTVLAIARQPDVAISASPIIKLFVHEVLGGIAIGAILGYTGYRLIGHLHSYQSRFLISFSVILLIAVLGNHLEISVPLAAATAGLIVGNRSFDRRKKGNEFLIGVWELIDEVLNTIVFVIMALQLVVMPFVANYWLLGIFAVFIILISRFVSISIPALLVLRKVKRGTLGILTWAGLRGGVSVAMALSLPDSPYRPIIISGCFFIVIFSIVVQGLTLNRFANHIVKYHREATEARLKKSS